MFGLEGVAVPLGFLLTILSTILCIVFGFFNWNRGDSSADETARLERWQEEERRVEESL